MLSAALLQSAASQPDLANPVSQTNTVGQISATHDESQPASITCTTAADRGPVSAKVGCDDALPRQCTSDTTRRPGAQLDTRPYSPDCKLAAGCVAE